MGALRGAAGGGDAGWCVGVAAGVVSVGVCPVVMDACAGGEVWCVVVVVAGVGRGVWGVSLFLR